jgi:hypothetical protein
MKQPKVKFNRTLEEYTYLSFPAVRSPMVRQIIGRLHVGESYLAVLRHVLSKIKGGRKFWLKLPKFHRRHLIASVIQHHRENRVEYRQVMARSREEFVPNYFWDDSTKSVLIALP